MTRMAIIICTIAALCACGASDSGGGESLLESGKGETSGVCVTTLPPQFVSKVETISSSAKVTIDLVASSLGCTAAGYEVVTAQLQAFAKLNFEHAIYPAGLVPEAAIYRIPSPKGDSVEVGHYSSAGMDTNEYVLAALGQAIGDEGQGCVAFSRGGSLLKRVFEHVSVDELGEIAGNLASIMELLENGRHSFERPPYERRCAIDSFSGVSYLAFLLDFGPARPETAHLFVYRSGWGE